MCQILGTIDEDFVASQQKMVHREEHRENQAFLCPQSLTDTAFRVYQVVTVQISEEQPLSKLSASLASGMKYVESVLMMRAASLF